MQLTTLDWGLIAAFFVLSLGIGIYASRRSGENASEFFLSGRNMPWWLLGISMVATTFSADTPNLVTDIVRKDGVAGNWAWWAFLLTGMLTVFVYARLWRRSGVLTDLEFYEMRYSGAPAAFLRGFRAFYLGVLFNIIVMATVCLAGIKIGGAMLNMEPIHTLLIASIVTVIYSAFGGLRGIIYTDVFQFVLAMVGTIWAAIVIVNLPQVGGLEGLLNHPNVENSLSLIPSFSDKELFFSLLIIPLSVQWWASYYPGSEPGGGGYIAQRMLAAKDEKNAVGATLLYNIAHYALRPWPWILIALASLVVFPMQLKNVGGDSGLVITQIAKDELDKNTKEENFIKLSEAIDLRLKNEQDDVVKQDYTRLKKVVGENKNSYEIKSLAYIFNQKNFDVKNNKWINQDSWSDPLQDEGLVYIQIANPRLPINKIGHDLAYPTMMNYLPPGLLGLVLAALIAAFMSTISTHLNWGSSYISNDLYKRFYKKDATQKDMVFVGRVSTVVLMFLAAWAALKLENAKQIFDIIILLGAGTGLIFILRWFWWRINAYSELVAMIASFVITYYLKFVHVQALGFEKIPNHIELLIGVGLTTLIWVAATFLTRATDEKVLIDFYKKVKPGKAGWQPVIDKGFANNSIIEEEVVYGKLPIQILCMFIGSVMVYAALFCVGFWLYGKTGDAIIATAVSAICAGALMMLWKKL